MAAKKLTPMMAHYQEMKEANPDSILFYRMGDFYEMFGPDAEVASQVLGITLTSRDKGSTNPVPMAGFPHQAMDNHLAKLIRAGHRVAVCDQVEDPKEAKGMVKREVTRVVTPGTLTDEALLDPRSSNYVAAIAPARTAVGLAWLDVSTGRFQCAELGKHQLAEELARIGATELLVPTKLSDDFKWVVESEQMLATKRPDWSFSERPCVDRLKEHFHVNTLDGFDVAADSLGVMAAGVLMEYVQETQKAALGHITRLEPYSRGRTLLIDETTRRSLELTRTLRNGQRDGSLLSTIDRTTTSMGARLLADWLDNPLTDRAAINYRLDAVEELVGDQVLCAEIRQELKSVHDIERLTSRVATGRCSPRDLLALCTTLAKLPAVKARLTSRSSGLLQRLETRIDLLPELRSQLEAAISDEPPILVSDGNVIRKGYNEELDSLRDLAAGGKQWIAQYQAQEAERTGITNLKVGFNKVFGYYLAVTAAHFTKVPDEYIRKQTLKNEERFITPELKDYEEKVLRAEGQALELETALFNELRTIAGEHLVPLQELGRTLATIDVLVALGTLASQQGYCRPNIVEGPILDIRDGRHPVLDIILPAGQYVPNDVRIGVIEPPRADAAPASTSDVESNNDDVQNETSSTAASAVPSDSSSEHTPTASQAAAGLVQIITGPNMAGKSTYIRQAALLTVMAQMGSFVPAKSATIGLTDRVFARVGASDELSKGQSTFMVEMVETARILNNATDRSLVILDEIGRGTSTYDGVSLAWAVTEYLHDELGCRTMFATHYHELTQLSETLPKVSNWNVAVKEAKGEVVFLHKIVPGGADRSYGIHVARLAGLPIEALVRAEEILTSLETNNEHADGRPRVPARKRRDQIPLFGKQDHPVLSELRSLNVEEMTPMDAIQELNRLRRQASDD